ncbi:MAG: 2-phosphosulfolactate phosphatase [Chloroflexota bacterium]
MMKFHYTTLDTCHAATGLVIVIDVIRAFTNAAYAFAGGVEKIYPVGTVDEALQLKKENQGMLACGEVGGIPPAGFDLGNSPTQVLELDLRGCTLVQRTGAGTQGIVRSVKAEQMVAASFVVADATVKYVQRLVPQEVTFVITGQYDEGSGDEDQACAEYLEILLRGENTDPAPFLKRVEESRDAKLFENPARPEFPFSDIAYCTALDRFDFAMPVIRENGRPVMRALTPELGT